MGGGGGRVPIFMEIWGPGHHVCWKILSALMTTIETTIDVKMSQIIHKYTMDM